MMVYHLYPKFWEDIHASAARVEGQPAYTQAGIVLSGNFEGGKSEPVPLAILQRRHEREFEQACNMVERELKRLRVSNVELEYSEGCALRGAKGTSRSVSLYQSIVGLREKLDVGSMK